jgi:ABC-type microcin C transport system permease subunit YejE
MTIMKQKYAVFILLGFLIGATFGLFLGSANENVIQGVTIGAASGLFSGWFAAIAVQAINENKE